MQTSSSGLDWKKIDLHVHTPASADYVGGSIEPEEFVQVALSKNLDAIAVTDHNSGAWIDKLKEAAEGTNLTVFPGVEVTVQGGRRGIHVIALFELDASSSTIEGLLSGLDFDPQEYDDIEATSPLSVEEAIKEIYRRGGLPVLPHADSEKGVLEDMRGQGRIRVMNRKELAAVEVTSDEIGKYQNLLDGTDHNYKQALPVHRASDNRSSDAEGHAAEGMASRYTYFKMDGVTLESLRQCFCDPQVRILTDVEAEGAPAFDSPRINSVSASKGFIEERCDFHGGLNCIVGGKGVGKSLLVEFVRFALDQVSGLDPIAKDHDSKLRERLGLGGKVEVRVTTEAGQDLTVERTFDGEENPIEATYSNSAELYEGSIQDLFPITAYSQTEAVEIARDSRAQLNLIDSVLDIDQYRRRIDELKGDLEESDHKMVEAIQAKKKLENLKSDHATLSGQIEELNQLLRSEAFEELKATEPKSKELKSMHAYVGEVEGRVEEAEKAVARVGEYEPEDNGLVEKNKVLTQLRQELDATQKQIKKQLSNTLSEVQKAKEKVGRQRDAWSHRVQEKKDAYETWAEEAGGDRSELLKRRNKLARQKEGLEKRMESRREVANQISSLEKNRENLLDELDKQKKAIFEAREDKYKEISEASDGRLLLELKEGRDRESYFKEIRGTCRGSYLREEDCRELSRKIEPREFFKYVFEGDAQGLAAESSLSKKDAQKIMEVCEEGSLGDPLSCQYKPLVEDVPEIKLKKEDGNYYKVEQLSIGQKCTALLIIALSDEARPVIIDQPEDALDIASVYSDVTKNVRRRKLERQFILTTHNPSVAVSGDADKFHILRADANEGRIAAQGAIDREEVKEQVVLHLEGGRQSFNLKAQKYGNFV